MMKKDHNLAGYVLTELMLSATVCMLIFLGVYGVFGLANDTWVKSLSVATIQNDTNNVMDLMVRGSRGASETRANGIREASSFSIPQADRVQFTSGIDGVERSFFVAGSNLIYDPDITVTGNEKIIADNIETLVFLGISSNQVQIQLHLEIIQNSKLAAQLVVSDVVLRN
jgi:hypothetical protein